MDIIIIIIYVQNQQTKSNKSQNPNALFGKSQLHIGDEGGTFLCVNFC